MLNHLSEKKIGEFMKRTHVSVNEILKLWESIPNSGSQGKSTLLWFMTDFPRAEMDYLIYGHSCTTYYDAYGLKLPIIKVLSEYFPNLSLLR